MPAPDLRPWWERDPERKQWELDAFAHYGLPCTSGLDEFGRFAVTTALEFDGRSVEIKVVFLDDHPDAPPVIHAPLLFERHLQLLTGALCVFENPDLDWRPDRSAAELVAVNAQNLLHDSAAGPDAVARNEADYPEPESSRYPYDRGPTLLVPDPFFTMELPQQSGAIRLRAVGRDSYLLCRVEGLGDVDSQLEERLAAGGEIVAGQFFAVPVAPTNHVMSAPLLYGVPDAVAALDQSTERQWLAITFPEEGPRRGQTRRAWVMFEARRDADGEDFLRLGRGLAVTENEREQRIPELAGLRGAQALVVGAGSVGSAICLELAKAGTGVLEIVDVDFYDPSNAVRHILPVNDAGRHKAQAVADACIGMNPFIEARARNAVVGHTEFNQLRELLPQLIELSDIVIDATGSQIVSRVLQRLTRTIGRPLVLTALSSGSHGGEIVVIRPQGGCFDCFVLHQADGTIPNPPSGRHSNVVPTGCSHPAFSGAGFDATELAASAARTAVQASGRAGYPPLEHDWAILDFRSPSRSNTGNLTVHPHCSRH